jgi:hypothetical protein
MSITESPRLFEREDLIRLLTILSWVRQPDNDYLASMVHPADVEYWANLINWMLTYESGEFVKWKMIPASFRERDYYVTWLDQFEAELPDDVKAANAVQLMLARKAAQGADNREYSTDMRLDFRKTFEQCMVGLQQANSEEECDA